jgi:hyperosmotically inducible protein
MSDQQHREIPAEGWTAGRAAPENRRRPASRLKKDRGTGSIVALPPIVSVVHTIDMRLVSNYCVSPLEAIMRKITLLAMVALLGTSLSGVPIISLAQDKQQTEPKSRQNLIREVRHQLVLLPYYSVFDNLAFRVEGDSVILEGQVVRPTLKSDAENVVKNIEGIGRVVNNIEVLPPAPMDDQIRRAVYRTIFGDPALSRYAESAVPSIHIIVKNGNVTLVGVVDSEADKNLVNLRVNGVPNVFSVKNELVVAPSK